MNVSLSPRLRLEETPSLNLRLKSKRLGGTPSLNLRLRSKRGERDTFMRFLRGLLCPLLKKCLLLHF